jgi:hypothetical protein
MYPLPARPQEFWARETKMTNTEDNLKWHFTAKIRVLIENGGKMDDAGKVFGHHTGDNSEDQVRPAQAGYPF